MLQRTAAKNTALLLTAILALQWGPISLAQHTAPISGHGTHTTAVQLKDEVPSGFQAHDTTHLGERTPLVLVHGIGGTATRLFHWEHFLEFAEKNEDFNRNYKIYLYHYDSTKSVPAISKDLQHMLKDFIKAQGDRNIKILAYSEGGLLVRNALQDKYIDEHTLEVLAIATPFHGSPLANPEWLQKQVNTEHPLNVVRLTQKIAYKITGRRYPTFKEDFHWDNFDGAIPKEQYEKANGKAAQPDYALAQKKNFTTYGAYFGMDIDSGVIVNELGLEKAPPKEEAKFSNLFKKNFLFSMVRNNIGKLPLAGKIIHPASAADDAKAAAKEQSIETGATASVDGVGIAVPIGYAPEPAENAVLAASPSDTLALTNEIIGPVVRTNPLQGIPSKPAGMEPVSMMMYNDGISPISSQLWLGRYTANGTGIAVSQPVEKLWSALRSLKGNPNTRLFPGMDHRNWMDGETRTSSNKVQDLLNPNEPSRTVFEWILYDLMT